MKNYVLVLLTLFVMQRWIAQVSGKILDIDGKPLAKAEIVYKNVGLVTDGQSELPRIMDGNGRIYKVKTEKDGTFLFVGMSYGLYEIEIKDPDGNIVYKGKKLIGDNADPNVTNVLNVDLSDATRVAPGAETNLASGKKTKEQLNLIHRENANAAKINRLIVQFHAALDSQDWTNATDYLQQLIDLDPVRWEFYQNLGTIQANQQHYQEASQNFAKGVEVAEKLLPTAADPIEARTNIGDMLMAEGDCYNRMGKFDEALVLYEKAAAANPHPGMAHYRACNALVNIGKTEAAIEKCNQAIADDPTQWEYYQVLGGALNTANKPQDALQAYAKGIATAQKTLEEKPDSPQVKAGLGQMLNSEGNLLVGLKKYEEAVSAFTQATDVAAYPAMPYFNLCATYYNLKRGEDALPACEHAIASDPTYSDAYYLKAAILFGQGKTEQGKYIAPPGTSESLNKYLEYAPFGQHASAVRSMIDKLNEEAPEQSVQKPAKKR
ncbi:MAG TPA: tetratricopeptide repeat protein [Candidatus Angelobacter sp.]|jgi:tetratricopeptide (TPR) repeat protein